MFYILQTISLASVELMNTTQSISNLDGRQTALPMLKFS